MSTETIAGGRYRVEDVVGHGGMATVYLAHDEELARRVAVKVLAEHLAGDPEFRRRFLREARLAAKLLHPNVVPVFDAGEDDGLPFIVMEYVEGETLAHALRREGRLPADEAVDVARQACSGLAHAHEHGLVHRDVKPANLLRRADGVVKIADFGIARAAETTRLTQVGTVLGTAAYLSPEQAAGEEVTAAADVYSLGAVLYELLTGRTPFQFESLADLAGKQRHGVVTPVRELEPSVPRAVEDVVMRCLARNPEYRPRSAAELAMALGPEPATAPLPTAPLDRAAKAGARHRPRPQRPWPRLHDEWRWIAIAAVVVLILIGIGIATATTGGRSRPPQRSIEPPAHGSTPAAEARNFSRWLRRHSR